MHVLAELAPLDPASGTRPIVRAASANDRSITALGGERWWPAILRKPSLGLQLFEGDFSTAVSTGTATFDLALDALARLDGGIRGRLWAGAAVTLYAGDSPSAWPWPIVFTGVVDTFGIVANKLTLTAKVDTTPFDANVLAATYAGTGGAEGTTDLKGKVKSLILGQVLNAEPTLVDPDNSVYQFSGYGPIEAVDVLYERGSAFPAPLDDYPTYDALVAADVAAGRWATCLAAGMIRLGAPAYGVITGDVRGDNTGGFSNLTGAIIERAAGIAGVDAARIEMSTLDALDTAAPYPVGNYITEQVTLLELARAMALPLNAQVGVSWMGRLFATRIAIGTPVITLDGQGRRLPAVTAMSEADVSPPYKRIVFGAARSWRVHTFDEIAFEATLIDLGDYSADTTYREGNIVALADGSRWLYVATDPSKGNHPESSVGFWRMLSAPPIVDWSTQVSGDTNSRTFAQDAPPTAAQSKAYDSWIDTNNGNKTYRRLPGSGLLSIGGHRIRFGGMALDLPPWVEATDARLPTVEADLVGVQEQIVSLGSDAVLSAGSDKRQAIIDWSALGDDYAALNAKYTDMGSPGDLAVVRSSAVSAYAALAAYLDSLVPAWDDLTTDTGVAPTTWQAKWTEAYAAISAFSAGISGRPGIIPCGPYEPATTYFLNNSVTFNGGTYLAIRDNFSGQEPSGTSQATAYWDVLAAPGEAGPPATPPSAFSATINLTSGSAINLRSLADAAGYTGSSDATVTFNVPNGVTAHGLSGGGVGIDTGSWPTTAYAIALTLVVQNGGVVTGGGGNGGSGGGSGGSGGDAIYVRVPLTGGITVDAGGVVRGGGGGGGSNMMAAPYKIGTGGGGGGAPNGEGGAGSEGWATTGSDGQSGTSGGAGGAPGGGAGGALATGGFPSSGGIPGGIAGFAVRKNGNTVAVTNNGTVAGNVA